MLETINSMDIGRLLLILSPLIAINLILFVTALVSIARKSLPWGQKWPWLLLLLVNIIGPIIYFAVGSNLLDEKVAQQQNQYQDTQERRQ